MWNWKLFFIYIVDPALHITEDVLYIRMGKSAEIRALVYSSSPNNLVITWHHNGIRINPTTDPRYSLSMEGMGIHVLTIRSVAVNTLGTYRAVATVEDRNQDDSILIGHQGKKNGDHLRYICSCYMKHPWYTERVTHMSWTVRDFLSRYNIIIRVRARNWQKTAQDHT